FDCRIFNVPSKDEAVNTLLWRELDATKNSISMAARCYYSHNQLLNLNGKEMKDLLNQKGVNWGSYPNFFKRGTYIVKRVLERKFSNEEIENLPNQHEARRNPNLTIKRSEVQTLELPPLKRVMNRVEVIFDNAEPNT